MRKIIAGIITILVSSSFAQKSYDEIIFPPLGEIRLPEVYERELPNGMKIYLVEDHLLPSIRVKAMVGARTIFDPLNKTGCARLTGMVLRTGGTGTLSGDEIDEKLESIGASITSTIGRGSGTVSLWVLSDHFDSVFPIFADILRDPIFCEEKLALAKIKIRTEIAKRNDEPFDIALREYRKLIYGEDSPFARTIEYSTLKNIERDDLIMFHNSYFHPNNIRLSVIGDFNREEMLEKIEEVFGDWGRGNVHIPPTPEVVQDPQASINFAEKRGLEQATILMGHIGGVLNHPDIPALRVMNQIFGGAFTGRLFRNVRTEKGLAYLVFGWYGSEFDHPGVFYLAAQTSAENSLKAIEAIKSEVRRIREEKVTYEELRLAKEGYLNSFVFEFDTREKIVGRMMLYDHYGYPGDFLVQMKEKIEAVTMDDVLRVAREHLDPDNLVILAVGSGDELRAQLSSLGEVNEIDIYRAERVIEEEVILTEGAEERAQDILALVIERYGGEAIEKVNNIIEEGEGVLTIQDMEIPVTSKSVICFPDSFWETTSMMGMSIERGHIGKDGWAITPQGEQEIESEDDIPEPIFRNIINLLKNIENPDYLYQYIEEKDGLQSIRVKRGDRWMRIYIDPQSHLVLKKAYEGETPLGIALLEVHLSDYKEIAGIPFPHKVSILADGVPFADMEIKSITVNGEIDPDWFRR